MEGLHVLDDLPDEYVGGLKDYYRKAKEPNSQFIMTHSVSVTPRVKNISKWLDYTPL
jgi:hypothetical protein